MVQDIHVENTAAIKDEGDLKNPVLHEALDGVCTSSERSVAKSFFRSCFL